MKKPELSIIILNHNTKELLSDCLDSLEKNGSEVSMEVIVSDNSSTDGSIEMIKDKYSWVKCLIGSNIGFANGNNRARGVAQGEFILFLNSDTVIQKGTLAKTLEYIKEHKDTGVVTCKLVLPNGKPDKDARRRFPTPWVSFKRLFLKSTRQYWYEDINEDTVHEVDSVEGAFLLTKKDILEKVNWFDEKYLFDGEDLDLCFRIKKLGFKIIYFPKVTTLHIKGATKGKVNGMKNNISPELKLKRRMDGVNSMEYFYKKNLWSSYPLIFNYFVLTGIKLLKLMRYLKIKLSL
jgi:GT2 family glycosyltransferase